MKYTYCESLQQKNQSVDVNGNSEVTDNVNNNFISDTREMILLGKEKNDDDRLKSKKQIDQKINRLQAMATSDDEDYGEALNQQLNRVDRLINVFIDCLQFPSICFC